jgi:hypothetical protein
MFAAKQSRTKAPEANAKRAVPSLDGKDMFKCNPVWQSVAMSPNFIQPKLAVNAPGDVFEQEADHVAAQVMRMPDQKLQRSCGCGGECPTCQTPQPSHERPQLQAKHVAACDSGQIAAPPIVHEAITLPGQPLDASTQAFFEPRFGRDFSDVRVHTDQSAQLSARTINADAYTVENDIVFGQGRFDSNATAGRRLLAHELAHVVQQSAEHTPGAVARQTADAGQLETQDAQKAPTQQSKCDTGCAQRWGLDTTCSMFGFRVGEHEHALQSVYRGGKGKTVKDLFTPCCNSWPWSLEDHARRHLGLNGAASCDPKHNREIATISFGQKEVKVLCSDTIDPNKVLKKSIDPRACRDEQFKNDGGELIEMSQKAMMDLSGQLGNRLPVRVCYSGSKEDLCTSNSLNPKNHPEIGNCLTDGCKPEEGTPKLKETGWVK